MNRRLGLWVSAVGALLATALIAAPVWDLWRYRTLRAPIGPHVAVGVILPLRRVPAAAPPAETIAAAAPSASTLAAAALPAIAPRSGSPAGIAPALAAATHAAGTVAPAGSQPAAVPRTYPAPQMVPAAAPAHAPPKRGENLAEGEAPGPTEKTGPPADAGAPDSGGLIPFLAWPAPVQEDAPQLPLEPQPGLPAPRPPAPQPRIHDPRPDPAAIPILSLVPPPTPVAAGQSFTVAVSLSGGSGITSLPFHVEFDPAVLQFQFAQRGPALGSSMPAILLASVSPARPGDLAVGLSLVESRDLLQGSGTVLRLQFLALAPGSSPLNFTRSSIRGSMSETLDAQFHGASVNVH